MKVLSAGDVDWRRGRVPLYVFKANDEIAALGRDAFLEFFTENALGGKRAFHGLKKMEDDIVAMGLSLFHAPDDAMGFFTTGGSESIISAVMACRDYGRRRSGRADKRGNIVLPYSAHPAFTKAARLMDIELRRIPVAVNYRADVAAMARAIDPDTLMLVGSAPCFSYGTIADRPQLAQGCGCTSAACVGSPPFPFAAKGLSVPAFDFEVAGVTSISADLHKFGFCPKPASTVFHRTRIAACQPFRMDDWPGGLFATATSSGRRGVRRGRRCRAWAGRVPFDRAPDRRTCRRIPLRHRGVLNTVIGEPDLSISVFRSNRLCAWAKSPIHTDSPDLRESYASASDAVNAARAPARIMRDLRDAVAQVLGKW